MNEIEQNIDNIWETYDRLIANQSNEDEVVNTNICYNCKSNSVCEDTTNGIVVCTHCGIVIEDEMIDNTAEWNFNSDDNKKDPSRCGCPINPLLEQSSMSTMIQYAPKMNFMRKLHNQMSMNYVERSRYHVFEHISKLSVNLSPVVVEQAKYYYKILSERRLSRGLIRKGLIACCIMYACKSMNVHRSVKEISDITDVPVPIINKTAKIFLQVMNDVLAKSATIPTETYNYEATNSKHLINRYCNNLQLDKQIEQKLIRCVHRMDDELKDSHILDCKTPSAITCSMILYASKQLNIQEVNKTLIHKMFNVSVVTLNKLIKIIENNYSQ